MGVVTCLYCSQLGGTPPVSGPYDPVTRQQVLTQAEPAARCSRYSGGLSRH